MQTLFSFLMLIGRIGFFVLFFLSGIGKFQNSEAIAAAMASKGMSMVPFFLYLAAVIEIVFAILLLVGYQTRIAALVLFLYLIPVTIVMHDFWNATDAVTNMSQMINFLKNIGILGGLLYVIAGGSGRIGIDPLLSRA